MKSFHTTTDLQAEKKAKEAQTPDKDVTMEDLTEENEAIEIRTDDVHVANNGKN